MVRYGSDNNKSLTYERLRIAKEAAELGIWDWDVRKDRMIWDDRAIEIFGFTPQEGIDEFYEVVHPEDRDKVRGVVEQALESGDSFHLRYRIVKEGETYWIKAYGRWLESEHTRQSRLIGSVEDITSEMARNQELEFFKNAINQNPDVIYLVDPESARFVEVTESVEQMLGYTRSELLSMRLPELDPGRADELNLVEQVMELKGTGPGTLESVHQRKDGTLVPVEIHVDFITVEGTERIIATVRDISERKEAQEQVASQERFMKKVNNQMPGVTYQLKRAPDGTLSFPYMSDGLHDLCAVASEVATDNADRVFEMIHDDDIEEVMEGIETSADQLTRWDAEARFKPPESDIKWLRVSSVPEQREDGTVVWSGVMIDVTDKKNREEELNHQKRRFESLFQDAPIGLVEEDWSGVKTFLDQLSTPDEGDLRSFLRDHPQFVREAMEKVKVLLVNDRFLDMIGVTDREEYVRRMDQVFDEGSVDRMRNDLVRLYKGLSLSSSVVTLQSFDGGTRHVLRDIRIVPGYEEDWSRVFVACRDITDRKRVEESLRKSELLYRTLFEEASEGFLIESFDDRVLAANRSAGDMLGYSADALQGMHVKELTPPDLREEYGEDGIVKYDLETHGTSLHTDRYLDSNGSTIPVEVSITPIDYDGTAAVLVCLRDRSELERIQKKDERKTSFVAQVTHDLRTPLNSITGMGELLLDTELSGKQRRYMQTILNASRNMERLTNDILDLNRIERGELVLDEESFNTQRLLGEVISLYRQELNDRDIIMSTRVSEEVPNCLIGDPGRLKQVLHNLVDNALRHTCEGSIEVSAGLSKRAGDTVVVSFSVSDTGSGIAESDLDDIFELYRQAGDKRSGSEHGLGIGLTICRNVVEKMNGRMDVESVLGEGTTFTFTVELKQAETETERSSISLNNAKVLIVEDNTQIRQLFRTYLEANDIRTDELSSGAEALENLTGPGNEAYDVVFLDRRLGDMSGVDVLKQLNDVESNVDPRQVYIVSGDPKEQITDLLDSVPHAGVLEKPVDESDLVNAVSSIVIDRNHHDQKRELSELQQAIKERKNDSLHILVADDDQNTRTLLNELLSPVADKLRFVANGEEAIQQRFDDPPHLMFMDLEMPGTGGREAVRTIRSRERQKELPAVPIIIQTAKAMKHVEEGCLDAGANLFVRKPIKRRKLYRSILDILT